MSLVEPPPRYQKISESECVDKSGRALTPLNDSYNLYTLGPLTHRVRDVDEVQSFFETLCEPTWVPLAFLDDVHVEARLGQPGGLLPLDLSFRRSVRATVTRFVLVTWTEAPEGREMGRSGAWL